MKTWLGECSFEMTPNEAKKLTNISELLPPKTAISIVHLFGKDYTPILHFSESILKQGFIPIPHIAARSLKSKEELRNILSDCNQTGIKQLLLIGGGIDNPDTVFDSVFEILQTGWIEEFGFEKIYIAGHPEEHPNVSNEKIWESYQQKFSYLKEKQITVEMITQFCFEPKKMLQLVSDLKKGGLDMPVRIGIVGKCSFPKLIQYSISCGIGNSLQVLQKEASNLKNIALGYKPESFLMPFKKELQNLENETKQDISSLIAGFHVFPFGNIANTIPHIQSWNEKENL